MTSVLVQAVVVAGVLVLNGWHLLPSFLNTAGNRGGRHSSAFLPQDFLQAQALLAKLLPLNLQEQVLSLSGR